MSINVSGPHGGNFVPSKNALVFVKIKEGALTEKIIIGKKLVFKTAAMYKYGRNSALRNTSRDARDFPEEAVALLVDATPEGYYAEVNDNGIGIKRIYEVLKIGDNKNVRIVGRDREALALNNLIVEDSMLFR